MRWVCAVLIVGGLLLSDSATAAELRFVPMAKAEAVARVALARYAAKDDGPGGADHQLEGCRRRSPFVVRCAGTVTWSDGYACPVRITVTRPGARYRAKTVEDIAECFWD